ncbi:nicotinic acid mononucleotide adenyltransferase [Polaribacter sp. BAL334]|uniref:toxin-antitoxin system YwqK family antitoxin n=1 Tax=Polaribacter sp. BAL334 TaxID=1708178 RepID=UPI0018D1FA91|nr:nicotinic acid mononucleotide adenyltransferase [Polaribacter sp. BAL334]MBG7613485.1 nicotinic acid mononucleotide adenyltransferase [Polaribacter sp. BAL334]
MKKLITICMLAMATLGFSQEIDPTYIVEGDLVKATYYYEDGSIKTQGFFKNKKLTGEWVQFDKSGNKTQLAYYNEGKKVGKWFIWTEDTIKEINYKDNVISSVNVFKNDSKVAFNNK